MAKVGDTMKVFVTNVVQSGTQCVVKAQVSFDDYSKVESLMNNVSEGNDAIDGLSLDSIHDGDVLVAKYSDQLWYRAQVLEKLNGQSVKVLFIDFGNEETVSIGDLRKVPGSYFTIPPLAVPFILGGIAPVDANSNVWSTDEIEKLKENLVNGEFTADVTQMGVPGRPITVTLKSEGTSVLNGLFDKGIGRSSSNPRLPTLPCALFEEGPYHKVYVTYTESPLSFWIQASDAEEKLDMMHEQIQRKVDEIPTVFDITPGMLCLAKYAETEMFYRAVISEVNENFSVKVNYIDYGNFDTVDVTDLKVPLPEEFKRLPAQAVPCCLRGDEVGKSNFNVIVEQEDLQIKVISKTDAGSLVVEFKDADTVQQTSAPEQKVPSLPNQNAPEPPAPSYSPQPQVKYQELQFSIGMQENACISNVDHSTGHFYCQLLKNGPVLDELMDRLQLSQLLPLRGSMSRDKPCLVRSKTDGLVYRASLERPEGHDQCTVLFVDFGFSEVVGTRDLCELTPEFSEVPVQCCKCTLDQAEKVALPRLVALLETYNSKSVVVLKLLRQSGENKVVELFEKKSDAVLSKYLGDAHKSRSSPSRPSNPAAKPATAPPAAKPRTEILKMAKVQPADVHLNVKEPLYVTAILGEKEFFGQLIKYAGEALEEFQAKLQEGYAKCPEPLPNPGDGDLCCTKFSDDGQFYRAEILSIKGRDATVTFIDFGNQEDKSLLDLYYLKPEFCSMPRQGVKCQIEGYSGASISVLETCLLEKETVVLPDKSSTRGFIISFPTCPENEMINKAIQKQKVSIPAVRLEKGSRVKAGISHIDEKGFVCFQLTSSQNQLIALMDKIAENVQSLKLASDVNVGKEFIAKYSADENWYRGQVKGLHQNAFEIEFIDYGNSEVIKQSDLREITEPLSELPSQSVKCSIKGSDSNTEWTTDMIDTIWGIVDQKLLEVHVLDFNAIESIYIVDVYDGKTVLNEKFGVSQTAAAAPPPINSRNNALSEQSFNTVKYKYQDLQSRKYFDCYISFIIDPSKFWINLKGSEGDLEKMMDELNEKYNSLGDNEKLLLKPVPSQACCVKYSEDNKWYRGKVIITESDGCVVSFVDYGNDEKVAAQMIKQLGPAFLELPVQGVECCLTDVGPDGEQWSEASIQNFEELTLEKKLVCNVVRRLETGKFEVELVDNTTDLSTAMVSSGKAKGLSAPVGLGARRDSIASSSSRGSGSAISRHSAPRGPASDAKLSYKNQYLPVGKSVDVNISYVENPRSFWCQLTEESPRLSELMKDLENNYSRLSPSDLRIQNPFINMPCCCIFSEDQAWYRGLITEIKNDKLKVKFIDYGNEDWMTLEQIKQIQKKNVDLPAQAIKCSLDGANPPSGEWTDEEISKFEEITYEKNLVANVTNKKSNVYFVELIDSKSQVKQIRHQLCGDQEVRGRQAADDWDERGSSGRPDSRNDRDRNVSPRAQSNSFGNVEFQRRQLRVGLEFQACVSWVNNAKSFYCQVEDCAEELSRLAEGIYDCYIKIKMNELSISKPSIGQSVIAYYGLDGNWYRGIITNISSNYALVQYADYGNVEKVPLSKVKQVKAEFARYPLQAVKCCLAGLDDVSEDSINQEIDKAFNASLEQPLVSCRVIANKNDLCIVDIQGGNGVSLSEKVKAFLKPSPNQSQASPRRSAEPEASGKSPIPAKKAEVPPPVPPKGQVDVYCTSVFTLRSFFVQLPGNDEQLENFASALNDEYSFKENDSDLMLRNPQKGQFCCAKFSEDDAWYRAKITDLEAGEATVLFIDYGNQEQSTIDALRVLNPKFESVPPYAFECRLKGVESGQETKNLVKFKTMVLSDKSLRCSFQQGNVPFEVEIMDGGTNITEQFASSQVIQEISKETKTLPERKIPTASVPVFISLIESPANFHVHLASESNDLDGMMSQIDAAAPGFSPLSTPAVGDICGALFQEDDSWYRARVTSVKDTDVSVYFIDYGNSQICDSSQVGLRKLDSKFMQQAPFAVKCRLVGLPDSLPDSATESLVDLGMDKTLMCTFTEKSDDIFTVKLMDGEVNIGEEIRVDLMTVEAPEPVTEPHVTMLPECPIPSEKCQAYISHIESLSEIYLQLDKNTVELDFVMKELESVDSVTDVIKSPEVGQVCSAIFAEDESWYRSKVLKVSGDIVTVQFVDYGNKQDIDTKTTPIRGLPPATLRFPGFAIRCRLPNAETYPQGASDQLMDIGHDKALQAQFIPRGEHIEVSLFDGDKDLTTEILGANDEKVSLDSEPTVTGSATNTTSDVQPEQPTDTTDIPSSSKTSESPEVIQSEPAELLRYEEMVPPTGKLQVYVSSIESPDELYLQFAKDQVAIEEILDQLEDQYMNGSEAFKEANRVPDQPCCAMDTDGLWYRGIITKVHESSTAVKFVDYGNTATVMADELRPLKKRFLSPPPYALLVRMQGAVSPVEGWSEDIAEKMRGLTGRILSAEILQTIESPVPAVLYAGAENLNKTVLGDAYKEAEATDSGITTPSESPAPNSQSEPIQLPRRFLKPGEIEVYISSVVSCDFFYVQLLQEETKLTQFSEKLNDTYGAEDVDQNDVEPLVLGAMCCAKWEEDGAWYRAEIQSIDDNHVKVFFVDFGNSEEVDQGAIKALMPEFAVDPPYAISCKLDVPETVDDFESLVLDKDIRAVVKSDCPPYSVDLYEGDTKLFATSGGAESAQVLPQPETTVQPGSRSDTLEDGPMKEKPNLEANEALTLSATPPQREDAQDEKSETESAIDEEFTPRSGADARGDSPSADDSGSVMTGVQSDTLNIGEEVNIRVCYIYNVSVFWCQQMCHNQSLHNLHELLAERYDNGIPVAAMQVETGSIYAVRFSEDERWYRAKAVQEENDGWLMYFIDFGNTDLVQKADIRNITDELKAPPAHCFKCSLSGIKSAEEVWSEEAVTHFENIVADKTLQCVAQSSDIVESEVSYRIQLYDAGNSVSDSMLRSGYAVAENEDGTSQAARNIPEPELEESVDDQEEEKTATNAVTLGTAEEMTPPEDTTQSPESADTEDCPAAVETTETLPPETTADPQDQEATVQSPNAEVSVSEDAGDCNPSAESELAQGECDVKFKTYSYPIGEEIEVYVSTASSPSRFWCQPALSSNDDLPLLMDMMQGLYTGPDCPKQPLHNPRAGLACAAQFSDDKVWYRAQITEVFDQDMEVCFIDYGNTQTIPVQEVKEIVPDFVQLPQQALYCSLAGIEPTSGDGYDKASCSRFHELVTFDDSKQFTMTVVGVNETGYEVSLMDGDRDVAQILIGGGYAKKIGEAAIGERFSETPSNTPVEYSVGNDPQTPGMDEAAMAAVCSGIQRAKDEADAEAGVEIPGEDAEPISKAATSDNVELGGAGDMTISSLSGEE